jgi:NAD(P)-dependent dehydrogenase (short-subunit alcohol dehydrogenase family)
MACTAYAAAKFGIEGWIESLTQEIASFGIRTMLVETGFFRTELLSTQSTTYAKPSIDDYAERTRETLTAWSGMNGKQGSKLSRPNRRLYSRRPTPTAICPHPSPTSKSARLTESTDEIARVGCYPPASFALAILSITATASFRPAPVCSLYAFMASMRCFGSAARLITWLDGATCAVG